jgi:hypothetical protein
MKNKFLILTLITASLIIGCNEKQIPVKAP